MRVTSRSLLWMIYVELLGGGLVELHGISIDMKENISERQPMYFST